MDSYAKCSGVSRLSRWPDLESSAGKERRCGLRETELAEVAGFSHFCTWEVGGAGEVQARKLYCTDKVVGGKGFVKSGLCTVTEEVEDKGGGIRLEGMDDMGFVQEL